MLSAPRRADRDELLFVGILTAWIGCVLYFNPRLLALAGATDSWSGKAAVIAFTLCLDVFWFYALYNWTLVWASFVLRHASDEPSLPALRTTPPVAVLYATRNDFRPECAESCAALKYPASRLFILDDGTLPAYREEIDRWAAGKPRVTVLRRADRRGFKAGNLNRALESLWRDYPYFAVCDADGMLPPDFLEKLLPFFDAFPDAAFVQAAQEANPGQREAFGRDLSPMVSQHYRHFTRAKNRFGFVMFYGHGAVLRSDVWREVGGFPERVTEDLAFAAKARAAGYRGYYTERVRCGEDFPPTFERFRTRSEKWIRGTGEFLATGYPAFFRSPRVPWHEKADVLAGALSHFQSPLMLAFLFLLGTVLPAYYDHFRYPGSFLLLPVPDGKTPLEYLAHVRYHIFWSLDFYLIMAVTVLGSLLPVFLDPALRPGRALRFLCASNFAYFASLVRESAAAAAFLLTGRAVFANTHDAKPGSASEPLFMAALELGVSAALFALAWQTRNAWIFAPAAALAFSPLVRVFGWGRWSRVAATVPFGLGLAIFAAVTLDLWMAWTHV